MFQLVSMTLIITQLLGDTLALFVVYHFFLMRKRDGVERGRRVIRGSAREGWWGRLDNQIILCMILF